MFKHFKNIDTAFKHIKRFSYLFLAGCVVLSGFIDYRCFKLAERAQDRVHILYNGKVLPAFASDRKTNLPVELRDHIKTFHTDFFTLVPDDKQITATINKALYLADGTAKTAYDNLREAGYYNNLVSGNINQQVMVDSIALDMNIYPYGFTCFATEKLVRATSTAVRRLVTKGKVSDLQTETDNNPHGFLIQGWQILQNEDETQKGNRP